MDGDARDWLDGKRHEYGRTESSIGRRY